MDYSEYEFIKAERKEHGILLLTLNRPERLNAASRRGHWEMAEIWKTVAEDPETRVVIITGAGNAFCAGGDIFEMTNDVEQVLLGIKEASDIVYNMIDLEKPVISAINGVVVAAGLAVALLADISIASEKARLTDGHIRLGVASGDHGAIIWPLLCGMAKSKYYLMTSEFLDGAEAERIGLVSLCVPHDQLMPKAMEVATKLATGPQYAIRWTKKALNNHIRSFGPHFDYSLALEMLAITMPDAQEGLKALKEKRPASYPTGRG